jgi:hypothetical protein
MVHMQATTRDMRLGPIARSGTMWQDEPQNG